MTKFVEKSLFVQLTFTEPILGSTSNDKEIYTNYIGSKAPDAKTLSEELEDVGLSDVVEKGTTVFLSNKDGYPYLSNHVIKGFFKGSAKHIRRLPARKDKNGKTVKYESAKRKLWLMHPDKDVREMITIFQRPLRASTPQGERIALASSEMLPRNTTLEFEVQLMDASHEAAVREWLDFGLYHGISQWRNADYGRFEWKEITEEEFLEHQAKHFSKDDGDDYQ